MKSRSNEKKIIIYIYIKEHIDDYDLIYFTLKNLANPAPLMVSTVYEQSQFYYLNRFYITYYEVHFF